MDKADFWERCVAANVVIVPFRAYRDYREGNLHEDDFVGIKFVGLENEAASTLDVYLSFETSVQDPVCATYSTGTERGPLVSLLGDTPEEALEKYIAWSEGFEASRKAYYSRSKA